MNHRILVAARVAGLAALGLASFLASSWLIPDRPAGAAGPAAPSAAPESFRVGPAVQRGVPFAGPTIQIGIRGAQVDLDPIGLVVRATAVVDARGADPGPLAWSVRVLPAGAWGPGLDRGDDVEPLAEWTPDAAVAHGAELVDVLPIDDPLPPGMYAVKVAIVKPDGSSTASKLVLRTID